MAITWGTPIKAANGWQFRVGWEVTSSSAVTASTASQTVAFRMVGQSLWPLEDPVNIAGTGDVSFSASQVAFSSMASNGSWASAPVRTLRTWSQTWSTVYGAAVKKSFTLSASDVYGIPGTATVAGTWTVPARPISAPAAPTGLTVTRSSDTKHVLRWTLPAADPARPVAGVEVQRWVDGTPSYVTVATVGAVSSWTDTSTSAGHRYRWRVRTKNASGASAWTEATPYTYTTPSPPASVTATRQGSDILLTWPTAPTPATGYQVDHQQGGGVWTKSRWSTTATQLLVRAADMDPALVQQFAVRSVADGLVSTATNSNEVRLLTPPATPTGLTPTVADVEQPVTLAWTHSSLDTSAQSAFEIRWREAGTTAWSGVPKTTGSGSQHILPAGTWTTGSWEWQVRTWGAHPDPGPWSALAVTRVAQAPSVTILRPEPGAWTSSQLDPWWSFFDPQGEGQVRWRVTITDDTGSIVWSGMGRSTTVARPGVTLQDGRTYTVTVEAQSATGLWSAPATATVDVAYAPPPAGTVAAAWDQDAASMVLTVAHPAPAEGEVPAVSCRVLRSTAGGEWVVVEDDLPVDTTVVDRIPAIGAVTAYRVEAVSADGATAVSATVTADVPGRGWILLNGGPGWARMVKVRDNARLKRSFEARRELFDVAGRDWPLSIAHEGRAKSIDVSVSTDPRSGGSTWAELEAFIHEVPDPICYRDATGERMFGSISALAGGRQGRFAETAEFTVTRIDHTE